LNIRVQQSPIGAPGPAGPRMFNYVALVCCAFWCQSTALVVSAVAQTKFSASQQKILLLLKSESSS
jgi:hypothetical protein